MVRAFRPRGLDSAPTVVDQAKPPHTPGRLHWHKATMTPSLGRTRQCHRSYYTTLVR